MSFNGSFSKLGEDDKFDVGSFPEKWDFFKKIKIKKNLVAGLSLY